MGPRRTLAERLHDSRRHHVKFDVACAGSRRLEELKGLVLAAAVLRHDDADRDVDRRAGFQRRLEVGPGFAGVCGSSARWSVDSLPPEAPLTSPAAHPACWAARSGLPQERSFAR